MQGLTATSGKSLQDQRLSYTMKISIQVDFELFKDLNLSGIKFC